MKTKQAKSFRDFYAVAQVRFFEEVFGETHEKVIAFNVILGLFRIGVIRFDGHQLIHDSTMANDLHAKMFSLGPENIKD